MKVQDFKDLIKGFNKFSGDKKGRENMTTVHCPLCSVYWPRLVLVILGLLILTLATGMSGGCGTSYHDEIGYYDPNWLTDGRIMAVKAVTTFRDEGLPGYGRSTEISHAEYIVSMKDDGTDEKVIYGGENKSIAIPVASPLGNYIAYQAGNYIKIISSDGSSEIKSIDCGESLNSLDWSPDETRMVYSGNDSKDMYILRISDEAKTKIATSAESVAWRVGEKIVYSYPDPESSKVYSVDVDGSGRKIIATIGRYPQISENGRVFYNGYGTNIESVKIDGTDKRIHFSGYDRTTLKLSFDNTKIVGGDLSQRFIKGVWVVNIDGSNLIKLRN